MQPFKHIFFNLNFQFYQQFISLIVLLVVKIKVLIILKQIKKAMFTVLMKNYLKWSDKDTPMRSYDINDNNLMTVNKKLIKIIRENYIDIIITLLNNNR